MEDFPAKAAAFLETIAERVRSLTVDRIARITKLTSLGMVSATLLLLAVIFLIVGVFRLVSHWIGNIPAYAAFGGLFALVGAFLWWKRTPRETPE